MVLAEEILVLYSVLDSHMYIVERQVLDTHDGVVDGSTLVFLNQYMSVTGRSFCKSILNWISEDHEPKAHF